MSTNFEIFEGLRSLLLNLVDERALNFNIGVNKFQNFEGPESSELKWVDRSVPRHQKSMAVGVHAEGCTSLALTSYKRVGISWGWLGKWCRRRLTVVSFLQIAMAVRIFTINMGEEALVRVNSRKPITLEFPEHLVTIYEEDGLIFQRVERQYDIVQTQEMEEQEAPSDDVETQCMDTDTQVETQLEDYEETQVEDELFSIPEAYAVGCGNFLTSTEEADIEETDRELYGEN